MINHPDTLNRLIAPWNFAKLNNSRALYPQAQGSGLPLLTIDTDLCHAVIAFQGAQLLEFVPKGGKPLLWLSPNCDFTPGKALRGGVPLCLPWFGVNRRNPELPKHGFARNRDWELTRLTQLSDGHCQISFKLDAPANDQFAHHFRAQLTLTLGRNAHLALSITNHSADTMPCSWALHSYHPVASLADVRVDGLAEREYLDNLENLAPKQLHGNLAFAGEVDRVFPNVECTLTVLGEPRIQLSHDNCPSVITWNPGPENARKIGDIGEGEEQHFICVERGAVLDEEWLLAPGENRSGWLEISAV